MAIYWYYYFVDKKERNAFVDAMNASELGMKRRGVYVVNVANDVSLENSTDEGFVAVLSISCSDGERLLDLYKMIDGVFRGYESNSGFGEGGSPFDF